MNEIFVNYEVTLMINYFQDECQSFYVIHFAYRLVGCQGLLEDMPWRAHRRDSTTSSTSQGDSKGGFMRGSKSFHGRSSNKSYTLKEDDKISSEWFMMFISKVSWSVML